MSERMNTILASAILAFILAASGAWADEGDVEAGLHFGPYMPFLSSSDEAGMKVRSGMGFGGYLGYDLSDQAAFQLGYLRSQADAEFEGGDEAGLLFDDVFADFSWSILTGTVRPRFLGGLGYQIIHTDAPLEDENAFGINMGLGLTGVVLPYLHVGATMRYHYYFVQEFSDSQALSVLAHVSFLF